ncbi:hypothetical protein ANANG_G00137220 [Anguilla anguilla]|uniref:Uncharacterized protein n=1 Tax=Anguilla anguilla TaxID=7936 RepID=A0A9D3RXP2_ANGAN|nr:hypothetical protein ANANG_G00137220 [Anguilla anguilla]
MCAVAAGTHGDSSGTRQSMLGGLHRITINAAFVTSLRGLFSFNNLSHIMCISSVMCVKTVFS